MYNTENFVIFSYTLLYLVHLENRCDVRKHLHMHAVLGVLTLISTCLDSMYYYSNFVVTCLKYTLADGYIISIPKLERV